MGHSSRAPKLLKEQERICRELGNKDGLSTALAGQALILKARGQLDEAMRLHNEGERICREQGNKEELARSLANQALLLAGEMGGSRDALPLADEAYRVATQHGLVALARQIEPILDFVRSKIEQASPATVYIPTPHPGAAPGRAAQLNPQYQQELAHWDSLPWWKRLRVKKPEPPRGI